MRSEFVETVLHLVAKNEISEDNAFSLIKQYQAEKSHFPSSSTPKEEGDSKDIAIIGVACRFPQARSKEEYWSNLVHGLNGIREIPDQRLELVRPFLEDQDKGSYLPAGYLDNIDCFDAEFFNIPPGEAKYMDPQQRIFMETGYEAIEDAGYGGERIRGAQVGVYAGFSEPRYKDLIANLSPAAFVGNFPPMVASRLSYALDLSGPSLSVATACSSSLVALHLACQGLLTGDCSMALVGGVAVGAVPNQLKSGDLGITSIEGRSRSFDEGANGTGWGEGCGVVLIKTLENALEDNDYIYSVIKGSAINQDGTSNGIASPNARAQEDVIVEAWENAAVDPGSISYMEAHGTGTKVGDPIEVKGITNAFKRYTQNKQFCGIGSVKSNIGHLDSASGMAGLIKTILALKNKQIPPTLHFTSPNPLMNLPESPLYINTRLTDWQCAGNTPLRAGVSSFGLSGTNCHVVLEEYQESDPDHMTKREQPGVCTLSARSTAALYRLAGKFRRFLQRKNTFGLEQICHVLNTGREHYQHRLAIPVGDLKQLEEKLQLFYDARGLRDLRKLEQEGIFTSVSSASVAEKGGDKSVESMSHQLSADMEPYQKAMVLARNYARGANIPWSDWYPANGYPKVPLPTYAWEKGRYWIDRFPPAKGTKVAEQVQENSGIEINFFNGYTPTHIEEKIATLWGRILGIKKLDVDADFFELGGDSLLATGIITAIDKELQARITMSDFFEGPSIRELSKRIEGQQKKNSHRIVPISPQDDYLVSNAQRRQYVLNQVDEHNLSYNMPGAAIISGKLNVQRFKEVFSTLVLRHESFRTFFKVNEDEVIQTILTDVEWEVEYGTADANNINQLLTDFIRPFNLEEAPLLRVSLLKLSNDDHTDEKHLFMFDMHHIISDGVSMEILIKEFINLYEGRALSPPSVQYKDYSNWQYEFLQSDEIQKQEDFWLRILTENRDSALPVLNMPYDFPRPRVMTFEGDSYSFTIPNEVVDRLKDVGHRQGATLYTTLLAIYNVLLYKYTGQEDVIVGSLVSGRHHPGVENTIGLFTNYLPMRNFPTGERTFSDFLNEVAKRTVEAIDNQDYPFEKIVEKLDKKRDPSRNPIFDTMLILHNQGRQNTRIEMDNLVFEMLEWRRRGSTMDLKLDVFQGMDGELHCRLEYYTRLFKKETMVVFAQHFLYLIEKVTHTPECRLDEYRMFTPMEKEAIDKKKRADQVEFTLPSLETAPSAKGYPLSLYQRHVWQQRESVNHFLIHAELEGHVDQDALIKSFEVIQAEDITWRITFGEGSSGPYQHIQESLTIDYKYKAGSEDEVEMLLAKEYQHHFNAYEGPLYRIRLLSIDHEKYHLIVTIHPLIGECINLDDFASQLSFRYHQIYSRGKVDGDQAFKSVSVIDYSHWQRQLVKEGVLRAQKDYWLRTLKSIPKNAWPITEDKKGWNTPNKGYIRFPFLEEELAGLQRFAERNRTNVTELLLASFVLLLKQLTQTEEIMISLIHSDPVQMNGNGVPLRINQPVPIIVPLEGISSFNRLLDSVKERYRDRVNQALFPIFSFLEEKKGKPWGKHPSMHDVLFVEEDWSMGFPDCNIQSLHFHRPEPPLLKLAFVKEKTGASYVFSWNTSLFESAYIHSLTERYAKIINTIANSVN